MDKIDANLARLLVGLSVQISRSDGRVHFASVKSLDIAKSSVMVEWHERNICRGKEVEMRELCALNPELLDHVNSVTATAATPPPPATEKKYEGRLRSSRIPAPPTCTSIPNQPRRRNETKQSSALSALSEVSNQMGDAEKLPPVPVATGRRKSVAPQGNKRQSCVTKPADMQTKKGKFGEVARPNQKFYQMIQDFRETLEVIPMSTADMVDAHRICVCVRKRPLNKQEVTKKEIDVISIPGNGSLLVHEPKQKVDLTKYLDNQVFQFDYSFDETANNDMVYRFTAKPLVQAIFEGGMATCFAYGQTGSGKTHTMGGDFSGKHQNSSKGIYAMAAQDVFAFLNHRRYASLDLCPYVSFFEIYNGKVYDLLNKKAKLRVLEDERQQVQVVGLQEVDVSSAEDVIKLIEMGSGCRTSGQTSANSNSSRSHAILQIVLRRNDRAAKLHGKFSLIDLAGNERGTDVSSNDRTTLVETAEINRSLLALKECIRSLGIHSDHIPFRMSTLTKVLRDSFIGEKSRTCMIAMVSPGMASCDYTMNTLRYADRVKELNGPSKPSGAAPTEEPLDGSSEEESAADTSVYDAISQVAELEEKVYEELQNANELVTAMQTTTYNIEAGLPDLMNYSRKLLDTVLAVQSAVDQERAARVNPSYR
ncbi:kinesin-like protein KIF2C [Diretmus argenteus]